MREGENEEEVKKKRERAGTIRERREITDDEDKEVEKREGNLGKINAEERSETASERN